MLGDAVELFAGVEWVEDEADIADRWLRIEAKLSVVKLILSGEWMELMIDVWNQGGGSSLSS
jgi:hypothetical protein